MTKDESSKEREILMVMRKVLASVIKDTTPPQRGLKHPLSGATIEDVRQCLALIAARERELADAAGAIMEQPCYVDDTQAVKTVSLAGLKRKPDA
ncbi:MAG: segregation and condensation protein A [Gammaproteobacteria bacterium]|nr:segregation and condensation protein A [Gammaproteobacteria bacterium]MBU1655762.1 segregation and condensation protein A [Gammaproteobacteria bacterium]MBU1961687.1 segregation and condensation protein A [Gammaproteobacteria bacterium]